MKNNLIACFSIAALCSCAGPPPQRSSISPLSNASRTSLSEASLVSTWSAQGALKYPGNYPFDRLLTLRDAIVLAGGLTTDADHLNIQLIHLDKSWQAFTYGQIRTSQVDVQAGDALRVSKLSRNALYQVETTPWPPFVPVNLPISAWFGSP